MRQRYFRLKGAWHPAAIGDGFVVPVFSAEEERDHTTYVQRSARDTITGFEEIDLGPDDVIIPVNNQREMAIGDRPLHGFNSRGRGLLIGNIYFLREALEAMQGDYGPHSSVADQIVRFLAGEVAAEPAAETQTPVDAVEDGPDDTLDDAQPLPQPDREGRRATFILAPLARGYGLTLGNALRRVLLSSIAGAAVTSIRIENVLHEFSSLRGVDEDVTDIVLNVKQIAVRLPTDGPRRLQLYVTGPAVVKAGDIVLPGEVEIMNPDLILCHLDAEGALNMELTVDTGRGYVPAAANRPADAPLGLIPVDALYSPVRQVSYKVEHTRVGEELDYDKLTLSVETDGTITPSDALEEAAHLLMDHLELILGGADKRTRRQPVFIRDVALTKVDRSNGGQGDSRHSADTAVINRYLLKRVDELDLSVRTATCLRNENLIYIGDLVQRTEAEMIRTPNFGRKSLNELKEVLSSMGLRLGMEIPGWPPENIEAMATKLEREIFG